jgi:hypothetical protein
MNHSYVRYTSASEEDDAVEVPVEEPHTLHRLLRHARRVWAIANTLLLGYACWRALETVFERLEAGERHRQPVVMRTSGCWVHIIISTMSFIC